MGNNNELHENWNERTKMLASYIPEKSNVLEFGAGVMFMKTILNKNQKYSASDLIKRYPETIVCDLNQNIDIDLTLFDCIVFSGVLEYVYDIGNVFKQLDKANVNQIILSYCCATSNTDSRTKHGWLSDFTEEELKVIFKKYSYMINGTLNWKGQLILI